MSSPTPLSRHDAGAAAAALLLSLLLYAPGGGDAEAGRGEIATSMVLSVAQCAPLVWRRQRPAAVAALVLGVALVHALLLGPVPPWPSWFALYAVARHSAPLHRAVVATGAATAGAVVVLVTGPALHDVARDALLLTLALTAVVVLLAALVRTEQGRLEALRERAASLERERDTAAREATVAERLRIARDLHDLVGHGLSSISVQAGSARLLLVAGDVDAAQERMIAVEKASRGAMQEMRQLLDVLRDQQASARAPSPTAAEIADLVDGMRAGGLDVSIDVQGDVAAMPASCGLAAYRIVQESLTNVMKHAPGSRAAVMLHARDTGTVLEVRNHGGPRRQEPGRDGHGVIGMRERVAALGGAIRIGPVDDDGWQVVAHLPGWSSP